MKTITASEVSELSKDQVMALSFEGIDESFVVGFYLDVEQKHPGYAKFNHATPSQMATEDGNGTGASASLSLFLMLMNNHLIGMGKQEWAKRALKRARFH